MNSRRFFIIVIAALLPAAAFSNYTFLGNLERWEQTASGVVLYCEGSNQVRLQFLLPEMLRVTLERANDRDALLEYAFARASWPVVPVQALEIPEGGVMIETEALRVVVKGTPCRIIIDDRSGNALCEDDPAMGMGWDAKEVRCWKSISADEKFFGLGEKTGDVNKRGREWTMWNSDIPGYDHNTDPLYQTIPFFIGSRGGTAYGIFFNNSYRTRFNMGAGNQRYYSFAAEQGPMDYFFISGPTIHDVVKRYSELTGRTPMPPKWALGYQQCRWSYYPDNEVMRIANTFREKQIPADVIYLDIHYMDGYRVFTWDKERFPNPKGMLSELEGMGFKVVTIIDPGVKADSAYAVAREGLRENHFVKYPDSSVYVGEVWPGPSYFPDFSRNETRVWWGDKLGEMLALGADGFWNDMNEPAVWGQAFPLETIFDDGGLQSSHKKIHNLYGFMMARSTYEGALRNKPDLRPFIVTRAGFAGEQRYTAVWTGDNVAKDEHLELGIRMMLGLGLSGVPFVGTDVGGFIGTPSGELMARWTQVGMLSPFFRAHTHYGSADQEPWSFGESIEEINRKSILRRYELLPYFYSLFWEAHETGAPLLRPLFWDDQDDPKTFEWGFQHQMFLGDKLLAAPVTRAGEYFKAVYLPAGKWLDWNTEQVYEGPQRVLVDAPLDRMPLFLREGAIVPTQDAMQWVDEKLVSTFYLDIFPSAEVSRFALYEDDGRTLAYTRGAYRLTEIMVGRNEQTHIEIRRVHDEYSSSVGQFTLRIHDVIGRPDQVMLNGAVLESGRIQYDAARRLMTVAVENKRTETAVVF